jgi:hypothetical protein
VFPPGSEPTEYCNVHVGLPRQPGTAEPPYDFEAPSDDPPGEPEEEAVRPLTPAQRALENLPPPEEPKKPRTTRI